MVGVIVVVLELSCGVMGLGVTVDCGVLRLCTAVVRVILLTSGLFLEEYDVFFFYFD